LPYHTYRVAKDGKTTIEHEARIKLHVSASEQATVPPIAPPPPPPKPSRSKVPALPAPTPMFRRELPAYIPVPYDYDSHQLEIESLPNLTPRHELEEQITPAIEYPSSPATTNHVAEPEQSTQAPTHQPPSLDSRNFPALNEVPPARRSGRRTQLPSYYRDFDMSS
jgi:hypothetical protein